MSLHELLEEPARLEMKANSLEREIQTKAIEQNEVFEKAQSCFSDVLKKVLVARRRDWIRSTRCKAPYRLPASTFRP